MAFTVRWLGQGGFLFKLGDKTLVIDPYLSDSVAQTDHFHRIVPIPVEPEKLACDMVVCTHDHQDHLDADTIEKTNLPLYAGPDSCAQHFRALGISEEKIAVLNRGDTLPLGEARITGVFARHTKDSIGVVIEYQGVKMYVTGDTEYDGQLIDEQRRGVDILFICINGRLGNMNAQDAARVATALDCRLAVPMHYGMFAENTETPAVFVNAVKPGGIPTFVMDFDTEYELSDMLSKAR